MEDIELFKRAFSHGYIFATEAPNEAKEYENELTQCQSKYARYFMEGITLGKEHLKNKNRGKDRGMSF
jgi:hypothetical protein